MKHVMQELGELAGLDVVRAKAPIPAEDALSETARPDADHWLAEAVTAMRAWLFGPLGPELARNGRCRGTPGLPPADADGQAASPMAER